MRNPWLEIPLNEYEAHMSLPTVDQARLLSDELQDALRTHSPSSVAIIGCAGGNGLERIDPKVTQRVVAVDVNPEYAATVRSRFGDSLPNLEVHVADVQDETFSVQPVEFVFAALLLEYVDAGQALRRLAAICASRGTLVTVIQLPSSTTASVSPSPFASVQTLSRVMRLVPPENLQLLAEQAGFCLLERKTVKSTAGKSFAVHSFRIG